MLSAILYAPDFWSGPTEIPTQHLLAEIPAQHLLSFAMDASHYAMSLDLNVALGSVLPDLGGVLPDLHGVPHELASAFMFTDEEMKAFAELFQQPSFPGAPPHAADAVAHSSANRVQETNHRLPVTVSTSAIDELLKDEPETPKRQRRSRRRLEAAGLSVEEVEMQLMNDRRASNRLAAQKCRGQRMMKASQYDAIVAAINKPNVTIDELRKMVKK
jgi:hypothetical protein